MAKKVRRTKKKRTVDETAVAPINDVQTSTEANVDTAPKLKTRSQKRAAKKQATVEDFRQEYAYVGLDLRRVLILSAAMFALLIVLNLILQI
ncbi:MAG: hypothetical protein KDE48_09235 [Anaerolineales bacterium]|nr:hypothetical protein [Anaerolineales bacterium]